MATAIIAGARGTRCVHESGCGGACMRGDDRDSVHLAGGVLAGEGEGAMGATVVSRVWRRSLLILLGAALACLAAPVSGKDQRGSPRQAAQCSIGAYEAAVGVPTALPSPPSAGGGTQGAPNAQPGTRPAGSPAGTVPNPQPVARP